MTDDISHMQQALALAARGLGRTWPNPAVGCVIVKNGRILGRGWTQPGGRPHAETMALAQAGAQAEGATAYVTLEPCAHHGKTPPCVSALISARVARVVTALTDPDPRVCGQGHNLLRAAGIVVTEGVLTAQARAANAGFLKRVTRNLPLITLKLATTLDGRIATQSGESRWITGSPARRATHAMRLSHDAVMVGSGTALADDPDLTVREMGASHQPLRILIDSRLRHNPQSRLGARTDSHPVWILHGPDAPALRVAQWLSVGAVLIEVPQIGAHLDLTAAMQALAARGLTRILCEGGASLAAALISARLVDDIAHFTAGALIGAEGIAALGPLGLTALADAPRLIRQDLRAVGADSLTLWCFAD